MRTLFRNARIFTGVERDDGPTALSCLLVDDDLIEFVGPESDYVVTKAVAEGAQVVDARSRILAPSFIDGHMHLLLFGQALQKVALDHCQSLAEIHSTIREAASKSVEPRILCRRWMHSVTSGRALASDLNDLDQLGRPIFVDSKDLHSSWCSTVALSELDLQDRPNPDGGTIYRNDQGNATGLLEEATAVTIVWSHLARTASTEAKLTAIENVIMMYNASGYIGMVEMVVDDNTWEALLQLRSKQELSIRIVAYWLISPSETNENSLRLIVTSVW
ncbi:hypothetical protein H2198_000300 [Neophaeococcomyces mojaviensis]|uniref:Uncharacterized protein n=1 Tax=Neophaeococcomyces mojaviensis TaxID=3383035 RepID=A0ACC3AKW2_9EURO|nr:hypothetical protein H2198_000300 [Knufia sp. JES_112]